MFKMNVLGTEISVMTINDQDFISITDMLKAKDGSQLISHWLRNRNTIEFLGIWERVHNPDFNYTEFDIIKSQAGLNSFILSANDGIPQEKRIIALNKTAISQMKILTEEYGMKKLEKN